MAATITKSWRANIARARAEATVANLKTRRAVYEAVNAQGATQMAVASVLGVSQPTVHRWLQEAARQPVEGPQALGETPYEIAQRYAAGDISREQMIDALVAWPTSATRASTATIGIRPTRADRWRAPSVTPSGVPLTTA